MAALLQLHVNTQLGFGSEVLIQFTSKHNVQTRNKADRTKSFYVFDRSFRFI